MNNRDRTIRYWHCSWVDFLKDFAILFVLSQLLLFAADSIIIVWLIYRALIFSSLYFELDSDDDFDELWFLQKHLQNILRCLLRYVIRRISFIDFDMWQIETQNMSHGLWNLSCGLNMMKHKSNCQEVINYETCLSYM